MIGTILLVLVAWVLASALLGLLVIGWGAAKDDD